MYSTEFLLDGAALNDGMVRDLQHQPLTLYSDPEAAIGLIDLIHAQHTLNNNHFLTAHFFTLNPGLADVRHITEPAAQASDITTMRTPTPTSPWKNLRDAAKTPRKTLFATLTEVRALSRLLDNATPPAHPG